MPPFRHTHTKTPYSKHQKDKKQIWPHWQPHNSLPLLGLKKKKNYFPETKFEKHILPLPSLSTFMLVIMYCQLLIYSVRILLLQYLAWTFSFNLVFLYITLNINIPRLCHYCFQCVYSESWWYAGALEQLYFQVMCISWW